jgi:hypothetical protein
VDPNYPPGPQDIPQQKTDKGVVENGIRVWVMSGFRFQQQKGQPGDKNRKEQSWNHPWQPQKQAAGQRQENVSSSVHNPLADKLDVEKISFLRNTINPLLHESFNPPQDQHVKT